MVALDHDGDLTLQLAVADRLEHLAGGPSDDLLVQLVSSRQTATRGSPSSATISSSSRSPDWDSNSTTVRGSSRSVRSRRARSPERRGRKPSNAKRSVEGRTAPRRRSRPTGPGSRGPRCPDPPRVAPPGTPGPRRSACRLRDHRDVLTCVEAFDDLGRALVSLPSNIETSGLWMSRPRSRRPVRRCPRPRRAPPTRGSPAPAPRGRRGSRSGDRRGRGRRPRRDGPTFTPAYHGWMAQAHKDYSGRRSRRSSASVKARGGTCRGRPRASTTSSVRCRRA